HRPPGDRGPRGSRRSRPRALRHVRGPAALGGDAARHRARGRCDRARRPAALTRGRGRGTFGDMDRRAGRWLLAALGVAHGGCVRSIDARADDWWSARTEHIRLESDAGSETTEATAVRLEQLHRALSLVFYHCGRADHDVVDVTYLSRDEEFAELADEDLL